MDIKTCIVDMRDIADLHVRAMTNTALARGRPRGDSGRVAQRDADDMLEDRPVAVPADASTGIVAEEQRLDEIAGG